MQKSQHTRRYEQLLEALRGARAASGMTQAEAAARLGVYTSYISKCESGERRVDVVELAEFCRVYGVGLAELLGTAGLI